MNGRTLRILAAEAAIGVSLCAGAYLLLVEPVEARIIEARQRLNALQGELAPAPAVPAGEVAKAQSERAALQRHAEERSRTASDEAAMFEAVMELATRHKVRVDQLQPAAMRPVKRPQEAGSGAEPAPIGQMRGYALVVAGTYEGIASFVDALQREVGLARVRAVRMAVDSRPGSETVIATIETEHLALPGAGNAPQGGSITGAAK